MTDSNSQSAGVRIRASNLNSCNDTTVRTREVPLVHAHATSLLYDVHVITSRNKWFTSCGTSGKLTLWTPLVLMPVAHGKFFCRKSFAKLFMKSFVKIICVVHGKTDCKMVWPATCGKYCELTEKLYSLVYHELRLRGPKLCVCENEENADMFVEFCFRIFVAFLLWYNLRFYNVQSAVLFNIRPSRHTASPHHPQSSIFVYIWASLFHHQMVVLVHILFPHWLLRKIIWWK